MVVRKDKAFICTKNKTYTTTCYNCVCNGRRIQYVGRTTNQGISNITKPNED